MKMYKTKIKNLITRYPVTAFFILSIALGAGTIIMVVRGILPDRDPL